MGARHGKLRKKRPGTYQYPTISSDQGQVLACTRRGVHTRFPLEGNALAAQDVGVVTDAVDDSGLIHGVASISASITATAALSGTTSTVAAVQMTPASISS